MAFMCPHLIELYHVKVSEIVYTYKPQIVLLVRYKDVSDGLILRGSLRKEEHDVIIKMKNSKSQVEALLLIIPKRMWGLENFISVLMDQNVSVWLKEELFQAYVRHLVNSIKKQQAEKKCECLQLKDGSYFRRRWIQLLKIFDAWIFSVGTSLGFMSQTLYPVYNSLAFINNKIPLPLPRMTAQQLLQLRCASMGYTDDQSVTVTEIDDDDVFEQDDFNTTASLASNQRYQLIGMLPTIPRETIAKPIRAITNGLIITPLKALNLSLTRSVDCLSNLTSSTLQISESSANQRAVAYPLHKVTTGTHSEALISVRPSMMSSSFKSHNMFSNSLSDFSFNSSPVYILENNSANSNSLNSSLARISQKYSTGSTNSALKTPTHNGSTTSLTSSTKVDSRSPKSTMINPNRVSASSTKSLGTTLKSPVSQARLVKASTSLATSSPSLLKSPASQKSTTPQPKTIVVAPKISAAAPKSSTKAATTEPIPEFSEDFILSVGGEFDIIEIETDPEADPSASLNKRSVGTNTIFHHSTVQQNLKSTTISPIKSKSSSVSSTLDERSSSTPRLSQPSMTSKTLSVSKPSTTVSTILPRSSSSGSNRISPRLSDPSVKLRPTIPQASDISTSNRSTKRLSDPSITSAPIILDKNDTVPISESANPSIISELLDKNKTISASEFSTLTQSSPTLNSSIPLIPEVSPENETKLISIPESVSSSGFSTLIDPSELSPSITQINFANTAPNTETLSETSSQKLTSPIVVAEISKLSSPKFSDEGISMSSSETVNSSNTDSTSTTSEEDSPVSKSSSLPNAKSSSKGTSPTHKGVVKRSISSVFDRLSKPKTKSNLQETKEKSSSEKMDAGRMTKPVPVISSHKKLANAVKTSESKSESNLAADVKKSIKALAKAVPSRPKFNTSTKIKPPPPPPPMYDRLSPEDYASQQLNLEWLKKWDDAELVTAT